MRVMVLVKANEDSERGVLPTTDELAEMGAFNERAGQGRHHARRRRPAADSSHGKRVRFDADAKTVLDGPFTETKELVAGYWIWEVASIDEAVEWLKRAPFGGGAEVELRPFFDRRGLRRGLHARTAGARGPAARPDRTGLSDHATSRACGDHRTVEAVWRIESARLIGALARTVHDVGRAEDLAQDALVAALEQWPRVGRPGQPGRLAHGRGQAAGGRPGAA